MIDVNDDGPGEPDNRPFSSICRLPARQRASMNTAPIERLAELGLRPLLLRGRALLPVVQGGMGVGVSAHKLASAVARTGAVGTIASVDLRHHHPDLMARCKGLRERAELDRVNLIALDREVRMAKEQSEGRGAIAVNIMKAVDQHPALVRQACASGADAIVMGAGLPLDLVVG